jgi:hypothetical protein
MNKLMGMFELQALGIPSVKWQEFKKDTRLDTDKLWTIRTTVVKGDDLNLPRLVGKKADESVAFGNELLKKFEENGMIIYYPYFIAEKSGTFEVSKDRIVIEAVKNDLWNLVTYFDRDETILIQDDEYTYNGNEDFLSENEVNEILKYIPELRKNFRDELSEGKSLLLEWSFAYDCNKNNQRVGDKYLVFYEIRTV